MSAENNVIGAAQRGDIETLNSLIKAGGNINEQDAQGWTALHWSAGKGDLNCVAFLLEQGADVTLTGHDNRTALMVARAAARSEVIALLTAAEQARGVWKDPRSSKPYCRAYYCRDFARYPQWSSLHDATAQSLEADSIFYLHQDFTVTKSVWPGENVIVKAATPEWIRFCESELNFAIPADIL
jgi:uncharacterized protein